MKKVLLLVMAGFALASCSASKSVMQGASTVVNFEKNDFIYSEQVSATANVTKVFGINWADLFTSTTGSVSNSIISTSGFGGDKATAKATYKLLQENKGYDLVFYPVYEKRKSGFLFGSSTDVTVRAKLGKVK